MIIYLPGFLVPSESVTINGSFELSSPNKLLSLPTEYFENPLYSNAKDSGTIPAHINCENINTIPDDDLILLIILAILLE